MHKPRAHAALLAKMSEIDSGIQLADQSKPASWVIDGKSMATADITSRFKEFARVLTAVDNAKEAYHRAVQQEQAIIPQIHIFLDALEGCARADYGPSNPDLAALGMTVKPAASKPRVPSGSTTLKRALAAQQQAELAAAIQAMRTSKGGTLSVRGSG